VGERSDPLCDGTRAEHRDDECSAPGEKTPAPSRGAQSGNDLELAFARRRELPANFGEAFLVFPRQYAPSGVGRTCVSPAVVVIHDLNAKAATLGAVGMSSCGEQGHLVNARSRLVWEAISEDSARGLQSARPVGMRWSSAPTSDDLLPRGRIRVRGVSPDHFGVAHQSGRDVHPGAGGFSEYRNFMAGWSTASAWYEAAGPTDACSHLGWSFTRPPFCSSVKGGRDGPQATTSRHVEPVAAWPGMPHGRGRASLVPARAGRLSSRSILTLTTARLSRSMRRSG
jgi:hypothetical protein